MKRIGRIIICVALADLANIPYTHAHCYGCDGGWGWGLGAGLFGSALVGSAIAASASRPRTVVVEQRADTGDVDELKSEVKELRKELKKYQKSTAPKPVEQVEEPEESEESADVEYAEQEGQD